MALKNGLGAPWGPLGRLLRLALASLGMLLRALGCSRGSKRQFEANLYAFFHVLRGKNAILKKKTFILPA